MIAGDGAPGRVADAARAVGEQRQDRARTQVRAGPAERLVAVCIARFAVGPDPEQELDRLVVRIGGRSAFESAPCRIRKS
jgi:hypothetical protein